MSLGRLNWAMTMVAAGSIVLCGATGTGATIVVDAAGGGDYTMIQDAGDAASAGCIIGLAPLAHLVDEGGLDIACLPDLKRRRLGKRLAHGGRRSL